MILFVLPEVVWLDLLETKQVTSPMLFLVVMTSSTWTAQLSQTNALLFQLTGEEFSKAKVLPQKTLITFVFLLALQVNCATFNKMATRKCVLVSTTVPRRRVLLTLRPTNTCA